MPYPWKRYARDRNAPPHGMGLGSPPRNACVAIGSVPRHAAEEGKEERCKSTTILLDSKNMPDAWYNIMPDMPTPMSPPLHPGTLQPCTPQDLEPIFPMPLIEQEVSAQPMISIPGEVMDAYRLWRPTPLRRAYRLEKVLGTPAKIFYKNESVSPSGSHKLNTAVAQAYYNKVSGVTELTTETGAGQWGTALSIALRHVQHAVRRVHGESQLRTKALPPQPHRNLRRPSLCQPRATGRKSAEKSPRKTPVPPAASAWPSPKPSKKPSPAAGKRSTVWEACSITCSCTRPSSALKPNSKWKASAPIPT